MDIQNLVRERVIGNIKIGTKGDNGRLQKLSFFNVEEDKGTRSEMVEIFKQLYPNKPTKLKIRFTSENPFNFKYKRYANDKAVCIGNGTKAITIGKNEKNRNIQIEVECDKTCSHRISGKCKLKGSLKFVLDGIEAGGVWNLSTSGGRSLENIASEIFKYKKAGMSIVNVPFDLTLTEQDSLAYGPYYSIDLHRTDIKPQLVEVTENKVNEIKMQETKQLTENLDRKDKEETIKSETKTNQDSKIIEIQGKTNIVEDNNKTANDKTYDNSNYMVIKKIASTLVNNKTFSKIILQDINNQTIEYILHPKANNDVLKYEIGSIIEVENTKIEAGMNVLCQYRAIKIINQDGTVTEVNYEELKKAV